MHLVQMLGGWWLDADIRIRDAEGFAGLSDGPHDHVFFTSHAHDIRNDVFGSVAQSRPILEDALLSLYRNSYQHERLFIAHKTGPGIFTRAVNRAIHRHRRRVRPMPPACLLDPHAFSHHIEEFETPYKAALASWQTA